MKIYYWFMRIMLIAFMLFCMTIGSEIHLIFAGILLIVNELEAIKELLDE